MKSGKIFTVLQHMSARVTLFLKLILAEAQKNTNETKLIRSELFPGRDLIKHPVFTLLPKHQERFVLYAKIGLCVFFKIW